MSAPLSPPAAESLRPEFGLARRELVGCLASILRLGLVDPGAEIGRNKIGKGEAEVGEVALWVDGDHRKSCLKCLFDDDHAKSGLARAGHAHDDAVSRQLVGGHADVARSVIGGAFVRRRIDRAAQKEVCHAGSVVPGKRLSRHVPDPFVLRPGRGGGKIG